MQPEVGERFGLATEAYKYGVGPIYCRVKAVRGKWSFDDVHWWWHIDAEYAEGTERAHGPWQEGAFYVSFEAVERNRREPKPSGRRPHIATNRKGDGSSA